MANDRKISSLISLCQKSGKLVSGEFACEKALRDGQAKLTIISSDASDNTKKKFINKSFFYNVKCYVYGDSSGVFAATGKQNRKTIIVTDQSFAFEIDKLLTEQDASI